MGGEDQIIAPLDVRLELGDDGVRVAGAGYDGVAVVAQHVDVHRVDLREFHVEGLGGGADDEADSADGDRARPQCVGDGVDAAVEGRAEGGGELVDQGLSAAPLRVLDGVGGGVLGDLRQEGGAGSVVGHQHAGDRSAL